MNTPSFATVVIHSFFGKEEGHDAMPLCAAPLPTALHETGAEEIASIFLHPSKMRRLTRRLRVPLHFHNLHHCCSDTVRKFCRRAVERFVSLSCSEEDRKRTPWRRNEKEKERDPPQEHAITSPTSSSRSSRSTLPHIGNVFVCDPQFPDAPFVSLFPRDMLHQVVHLSTEEIHVEVYEVPPSPPPSPPPSVSIPFCFPAMETRDSRCGTAEEARDTHHSMEEDVFQSNRMTAAPTTEREGPHESEDQRKTEAAEERIDTKEEEDHEWPFQKVTVDDPKVIQRRSHESASMERAVHVALEKEDVVEPSRRPSYDAGERESNRNTVAPLLRERSKSAGSGPLLSPSRPREEEEENEAPPTRAEEREEAMDTIPTATTACTTPCRSRSSTPVLPPSFPSTPVVSLPTSLVRSPAASGGGGLTPLQRGGIPCITRGKPPQHRYTLHFQQAENGFRTHEQEPRKPKIEQEEEKEAKEKTLLPTSTTTTTTTTVNGFAFSMPPLSAGPSSSTVMAVSDGWSFPFASPESDAAWPCHATHRPLPPAVRATPEESLSAVTVQQGEAHEREASTTEARHTAVEEKEKNWERVGAWDRAPEESTQICRSPHSTPSSSRKRYRESDTDTRRGEGSAEEGIKAPFPKNVIMVDIDAEEAEGRGSGTPGGPAATRVSLQGLSVSPTAAALTRSLGWGKKAEAYFDPLTYCDDPCKAKLPMEMLGRGIKARHHDAV